MSLCHSVLCVSPYDTFPSLFQSPSSSSGFTLQSSVPGRIYDLFRKFHFCLPSIRTELFTVLLSLPVHFRISSKIPFTSMSIVLPYPDVLPREFPAQLLGHNFTYPLSLGVIIHSSLLSSDFSLTLFSDVATRPLVSVVVLSHRSIVHD